MHTIFPSRGIKILDYDKVSEQHVLKWRGEWRAVGPTGWSVWGKWIIVLIKELTHMKRPF